MKNAQVHRNSPKYQNSLLNNMLFFVVRQLADSALQSLVGGFVKDFMPAIQRNARKSQKHKISLKVAVISMFPL